MILAICCQPLVVPRRGLCTWLQQDFSLRPSRVQLTLSAQLIDVGTRRVIASAEFDETEDAYGGVRAAKLADFCIKHAPPP